MYRCRIRGAERLNQYEELIKIFLQPSQFDIAVFDDGETFGEDDFMRVYDFTGDKDEVKRAIYRDLEGYTETSPKWGIVTGIRPVKMAGEIYRKEKDIGKTEDILREKYLIGDEKIELVSDMLKYQLDTAGYPPERSLSLYLGIPFCPTRCLYCSFTSNQAPQDKIEGYLDALRREIEYCGKAVREDRFVIESVYIGGGTPTTLDPVQLDRLLGQIQENFDLSSCREFTVEAGRPDTITPEKLTVLKNRGIERISINPQTMKDDTLRTIGRAHTVDDILRAFRDARETGMEIINTDLIAGLPGEDFGDFERSLEKMIELEAENITVHTLAVKRASRLKEMDADYNYRKQELVERMLSFAHRRLGECGYTPYYLYKQKHISRNTENTGFCRDDHVSIYNIRIMEEAQSILALGAGGISKIYFPGENRLERVANVSNYEIYVERIDEMIQRKKDSFFGQDIWR